MLEDLGFGLAFPIGQQGIGALVVGDGGAGSQDSLGLALKAIEHGHHTYFLTLHDLVNKVRLAREKNRLHVLHATLQRADVWLLDELGFQPLDRHDATFLFEAVNKRYAAGKSTIITSNKSYGQWHEIFPDPVLAVALVDRLLHHSVVLNIRGDLYRQRHRKNAGLPNLHASTPESEELRGTNM